MAAIVSKGRSLRWQSSVVGVLKQDYLVFIFIESGVWSIEIKRMTSDNSDWTEYFVTIDYWFLSSFSCRNRKNNWDSRFSLNSKVELIVIHSYSKVTYFFLTHWLNFIILCNRINYWKFYIAIEWSTIEDKSGKSLALDPNFFLESSLLLVWIMFLQLRKSGIIATWAIKRAFSDLAP